MASALVAVSVEVGGVEQQTGTLPDGKRFVVATGGKPYTIVVRNRAHRPICCYVRVDGKYISSRGWVLDAYGDQMKLPDYETHKTRDHAGNVVCHTRRLQFASVPLVASRDVKKKASQVLTDATAIESLGEISVDLYEAYKSHPATLDWDENARAPLVVPTLVEGSSIKVCAVHLRRLSATAGHGSLARVMHRTVWTSPDTVWLVADARRQSCSQLRLN